MTQHEQPEPVLLKTTDIEKALRQAYRLGQTYWQQADSDSFNQHKKADVTRRAFEELVVTTTSAITDQATILAWAVEQWQREVANRPLINTHRRSLDDTWRQVVRKCGGDPEELLGPSHDALLARAMRPI